MADDYYFLIIIPTRLMDAIVQSLRFYGALFRVNKKE